MHACTRIWRRWIAAIAHKKSRAGHDIESDQLPGHQGWGACMNKTVMKPGYIPSESAAGANPCQRLCVITVTYGERHPMFAQVLERLATLGVGSIVAVFNGNYRPYTLAGHTRFVSIDNPDNLGSAGGFRLGIEAARQIDADYYLLLDDDNLPELDCLNKLFAVHAELGGNPMQALLAYRPGQPWQGAVAQRGVVTVGRPNTYGWFNLLNLTFRLGLLLGISKPARNTETSFPNAPVRIDRAPYGGLLLSRQALLLPELPDPRFFCYYDDLDFSERLARHGVTYHLCTEALIRDLELSWYVHKGRVHPLFSPVTSDQQIFFDLRNAFIFYRTRMRSRTIYLLNGIGFWAGILSLALFRSADPGTTRRRLATIRRAVHHGSRGEFASY